MDYDRLGARLREASFKTRSKKHGNFFRSSKEDVVRPLCSIRPESQGPTLISMASPQLNSWSENPQRPVAFFRRVFIQVPHFVICRLSRVGVRIRSRGENSSFHLVADVKELLEFIIQAERRPQPMSDGFIRLSYVRFIADDRKGPNLQRIG